jgi:NDP-sugar pyrophosphorylase family protein
MEAVIFAGGRGKRLRPLTDKTPKSLVIIAGKPILYWQLKWLELYDVDSIIIAGGYLSHRIKEYINNKFKGMNIRIAREDKPLGTGGALRNAESLINGSKFYALNGDNITNLNLSKLKVKNSDVGEIALTPLYSDKGVVVTRGSRIEMFKEKPKINGYWMNAGVYLLTDRIFKYLPKEGDIESATFAELAKKGLLGCVKFSDAYLKSVDSFKDIEKISDYLKSNELFKRNSR